MKALYLVNDSLKRLRIISAAIAFRALSLDADNLIGREVLILRTGPACNLQF